MRLLRSWMPVAALLSVLAMPAQAEWKDLECRDVPDGDRDAIIINLSDHDRQYYALRLILREKANRIESFSIRFKNDDTKSYDVEKKFQKGEHTKAYEFPNAPRKLSNVAITFGRDRKDGRVCVQVDRQSTGSGNNANTKDFKDACRDGAREMNFREISIEDSRKVDGKSRLLESKMTAEFNANGNKQNFRCRKDKEWNHPFFYHPTELQRAVNSADVVRACRKTAEAMKFNVEWVHDPIWSENEAGVLFADVFVRRGGHEQLLHCRYHPDEVLALLRNAKSSVNPGGSGGSGGGYGGGNSGWLTNKPGVGGSGGSGGSGGGFGGGSGGGFDAQHVSNACRRGIERIGARVVSISQPKRVQGSSDMVATDMRVDSSRGFVPVTCRYSTRSGDVNFVIRD